MSDDKTPTEKLVEYTDIYAAGRAPGANQNHKNDELEVVFGYKRDLTQIEFESVISKLKSLGWTTTASGQYHLNIQNQYIDQKTGKTGIGNIRTTIAGIKNIQDYCKNNGFDFSNPPSSVSFMQKVIKVHNGQKLFPINFDDFRFRVNYKEEKVLKKDFGIVQDLLQSWNEKKKVYRLIKRFSFKKHNFTGGYGSDSQNFPVRIDCSVVRSSKKIGRRLVPEFRIESSGVLNNPETYEIEIEVDNSNYIGSGAHLLGKLRETIKYVMSGIQNSNFPISYTEQDNILGEYMHVLYKEPPARRVRTRDFVGPSSISLERPNIAPLTDDMVVPNIRSPYTVTEKADGIRKLLFINDKGKVYMIDVNMNVQFTGAITKVKEVFNSILDGEHVPHNKYGLFINNYLAFDIYYINKKDLRDQPFYEETEVTDDGGVVTDMDERGRLVALKKFMTHLKLQSVIESADIPIKIKAKEFHYSDNKNNAIFQNCRTVLERVRDDLFEYETDGLIFTPANTGVGSERVGEVLDPVKRTWRASFKWKPPEHNTIDFLVTTMKTEGGTDIVKNIFEQGDDMRAVDNMTQYKTLQLRVGFDERRDGYLNPCEDIIQDRLPRQTTREEASQYKPVPFYPMNPTPQYPAYLCNIVLEDTGNIKIMTTEDKTAVIEDEMIVEFKYDQTKDKFWQWVPIKVRLDKTADYRSGGRNYGNAYHVAQSVWNSIHNPITEEMITTGIGIPDLIADDDIYYNKKSSGTVTRSLRDFHNLYVKRALILSASKRGGTLIDMTVGKGGDFPKWIAAKLSFVFGLDLSRDNIENRLNGACARFLNYRKQFRSMPYALFVHGNSGLNIRSTEAIFSDKGKEITRAVFGDGPKDEAKLGKGVYRQYGKGRDGFDVVSNQFSIHYFFKDANTLNNFLRNVSECCSVGGYFIGTSYNGREVFRRLQKKRLGDSISIRTKDGTKMWEIKKQYSAQEFNNDSSSLGYQIDVFQESINKTFSEYLVNYQYLVRIMENYGFTLLTTEEARSLGLPASMGGFDQLFYQMETELKLRKIRKNNIGTAAELTTDEKKISFLNNYFIFKKVRDVNAEKVSRMLIDSSPQAAAEIQAEEGKINLVLTAKAAKRPRVKKMKNKIKIGTVAQTPSIVIPEIADPVEEPVVAIAPGTRVKVKVGKKKKAKIKVKVKKPKGEVRVKKPPSDDE